MEKSNLSMFDKCDDFVKDSILKYVDLVKDYFIPDYFESEEDLLIQIVNNIKCVVYSKDMREKVSSYTFSTKVLLIGYDSEQYVIIHEIHHIVQSISLFNILKKSEYGCLRYSDEVIVEKINSYYVKYSYFYEGMACYWETKFLEKQNNTNYRISDSYQNTLKIINKLIQLYGIETIIKTDLFDINALSSFYDICLFNNAFIIVAAIENVNCRIYKIKYEKRIADSDKSTYLSMFKKEFDEKEFNEKLNILNQEKQKYLEAIELFMGITDLV